MKKIYTGSKAKEISFPLGGIGTGSIGLAGNGSLIDWEIYNRPNKRSFNGFSHFAVKAEADGNLLDARVLNGDLHSPYVGEYVRGGAQHSGYGYGPESNTMAGMPHFKDVAFSGEFPLAEMTFSDNYFPGNITLNAFNPLIPLNDLDSSIPAAFFEIEFENTSDISIAYTACLSVGNRELTGLIHHQHHVKEADASTYHITKLSSSNYSMDDPRFGDISLATDASSVSFQEFWYRGGWCDNLEMFWRDFTKPGLLTNRSYTEDRGLHPRHNDMSSLAAHIELLPGAKQKIRFVISWSYPNCQNFWNPEKGEPTIWKNYYATIFEDSCASAAYALQHWNRLYEDTRLFKETLFASTLPPVVLEAISANLSVLKSPTVLRLTDGSFYGFEGCIADVGSCEGSCTHVWNYAYALPFLFPKLERSMHELDFKYNKRADGRMSFRLMLPVGRETADFHACADGQFGGVIKAYRDWKISGDFPYLESNWAAIKQSIEYAWAESNEDKWDPQKRGVLEGRQHHTLDMELYGPNSWLNGFYLAALKAGAEMAAYLGEHEVAVEYSRIFEKGRKWTDEHLFNGDYYTQKVDLQDRSLLERFSAGETIFGDNALQAYWNEEVQEIKYQISGGCMIDQVIAQWHANLCGLGEIFDKQQVRKALQALYRNNFKPSMRNEANTWRLYSLNDEGGLIICSWPDGSIKPAVPLTYAPETMTGFEYQAASHMIQEGLIEEGLSIVMAIRNRYDGEKRNPWNEIECGSNYARSMASYSLLNAFSGFEFNAVEGMIGFHPVLAPNGSFQTFWSLEGGWGLFKADADTVVLQVLNGTLNLSILKLPEDWLTKIKSVQSANVELSYQLAPTHIYFPTPLILNDSHSLSINLIPAL
ncbi:hypothetical protein EHS13_27090 [Paenibacillus psychroresistens]|uniref:Beta-glucosidase n=1 Tax=Paenibacillus psychroresistens TaxID=1778678 RepID=A0A6B8RSU1_9BACL|nr:GH116 family glycosyl-hydrolase [Paenibacillus psychroresistens]QGQ98288.1 hypothetical protein EHS13_27090 [Paenibacillus psychroresistens]